MISTRFLGIMRFVLFTFMVAGLGACGQKPSVLRVGYIPIADSAQLFIAQEQGLFASNGLTVELTSMPGGAPILEALGSGSLDVGFSNVVSLILARGNGLPFVAFTGGPAEDAQHQEHGLFVKKGSPLTTVAALAGKRIALNTRRNIDELMVSELLTQAGIDLKAVAFVEVPFPRMVTVLEAGDVDAIAAIEPFVGLARERGHQMLSSNYVAVQPTTEISTYVAVQKWLNDHPREVDAFRRSIAAAGEMANKDPNLVRTVLQKYTRLEPAQLARIGLPLFTRDLSEPNLQQMIDRVVKAGWLSAAPSARDLIAK